MRIAVTGASGVIGRGITARLLSQGHDVVGLARRRPQSWPSAAAFVEADIRDADTVGRGVAGADVVAHLAWLHSLGDQRDGHDVNVGGTRNVLHAMAETGSRRIVFASSPLVYGRAGVPKTEDDATAPVLTDGVYQARVEDLLAAAGVEWVAVRCALVVGRNVDNWVRRLLALPAFPDGSADDPLQVVHLDDALRLFTGAVVADEIEGGPVNLAAPGARSLRELAARLGRPVLPRVPMLAPAELGLVRGAPVMDTARLQDRWAFRPAWTCDESIEDVALAVRGRITLGKRVVSLPWRLANVADLPAVNAAAEDGVVPELAGPAALNGEFDTPIDPRFPTFLATNLSEALPGPFSPSSASTTVRGLRAGGAVIAERLRPGGIVQREIAMRTVAVSHTGCTARSPRRTSWRKPCRSPSRR